MWRKPGTEAPATAAPPTPAGETLLELDRGKGKTMRVARESYEGHPFISLRVWENGFPTKSGTSLRLRELPELLRVLSQFEEDEPDDRPQFVEKSPRPQRVDTTRERPVPSSSQKPFSEFDGE